MRFAFFGAFALALGLSSAVQLTNSATPDKPNENVCRKGMSIELDVKDGQCVFKVDKFDKCSGQFSKPFGPYNETTNECPYTSNAIQICDGYISFFNQTSKQHPGSFYPAVKVSLPPLTEENNVIPFPNGRGTNITCAGTVWNMA
ncbi:hypothetical protein N7492_010320 [Penicillium capsulatum]|uniref:Uncharacterized protein n=1 Tax=Penicillium capsulatum TaxID=69766 RepID=A0A9W9HNJ1_9EURO|nr:hypothetical protein N7492_010320 [Penicillium capsulatum]